MKNDAVDNLIHIVEAIAAKLSTPPRPQLFPTWKTSAEEQFLARQQLSAKK
jgi:hypothetical protein